MKESMKKLGWGIIAVLTCPCHLVLIVPLLAGTAFGAYIAVHQKIVGLIFGILFVISLYMMFKRKNKQDSSKNCDCFPNQNYR